MTRMRAIGAAVALSAVLAACGGSGGGNAAGKDGAGSSAPGAGGSTAGSAAGKDGSKDSGLPIWDENRKMNDTSGYSSPIAKIMGFDPASQDQAAMEAKFKEREQKRQEAIAECMRAQGFEYTPYVPDQSFMGFTPPGYDLTRKEYVEKYGFGISTMVDQQMNQPPEGMPKPEDDPNFVYMQTLSPSDSEAYNKARYGDMVMEAPIDESDTGDSSGDGADSKPTAAEAFVPQGCEGEGEKAVTGGGGTDADKAFVEEFNQRINKLYESVQADRRVVDATRAYATCMADKGYPEIDKQEKAYEQVSNKMQPLWEAQGAGMVGEDDSGSSGAVAATIVVGGQNGVGPTPTFDPVKLKEVNDYEIGVAKADLACGKDVMKTTYEVSQELEQKFVDDNAADVERFKQLNDNGLGGRG